MDTGSRWPAGSHQCLQDPVGVPAGQQLTCSPSFQAEAGSPGHFPQLLRLWALSPPSLKKGWAAHRAGVGVEGEAGGGHSAPARWAFPVPAQTNETARPKGAHMEECHLL